MSIERYLEKHAEPSATWALSLPDGDHGGWEAGVVVPLYDETRAAVMDHAAGLSGRNALLVLVLNEPPDAPAPAVAANAAVTAFINAQQGLWVSPTVWLGRVGDCPVLMLELTARAGCPVPADDGVGGARKAGLDLCLQLHHCGRLRKPWLYTTDADASLPEDYLDAVLPDSAALTIFPFWHVPGGDAVVDELTGLYELWLRYYAAGLRWAGSPFGVAALGSTMAVSAPAYAAVRGCPKRAAGEDFYLASKLISVGPVHRAATGPILIRSRSSARVPFGTGPAVARWRDSGTAEFYDPRVFDTLRRATLRLAAVETGAAVPTAGEVGPQLSETWEALGLYRGLTGALRGARTEAVRRHRVRQWFDGLKVLRFVHGVERANAWPRLEAKDALARAPFVADVAEPNVDAYRRALGF